MDRGDDIRWSWDGASLVTGWCGPNWPARRFLVVEATPDGSWDWVAWRGCTTAALCGLAGTREAAMHDAERAVARLREDAPM